MRSRKLPILNRLLEVNQLSLKDEDRRPLPAAFTSIYHGTEHLFIAFMNSCYSITGLANEEAFCSWVSHCCKVHTQRHLFDCRYKRSLPIGASPGL